jgi:hypothetical protein
MGSVSPRTPAEARLWPTRQPVRVSSLPWSILIPLLLVSCVILSGYLMFRISRVAPRDFDSNRPTVAFGALVWRWGPFPVRFSAPLGRLRFDEAGVRADVPIVPPVRRRLRWNDIGSVDRTSTGLVFRDRNGATTFKFLSLRNSSVDQFARVLHEHGVSVN